MVSVARTVVLQACDTRNGIGSDLVCVGWNIREDEVPDVIEVVNTVHPQLSQVHKVLEVCHKRRWDGKNVSKDLMEDGHKVKLYFSNIVVSLIVHTKDGPGKSIVDALSIESESENQMEHLVELCSVKFVRTDF